MIAIHHRQDSFSTKWIEYCQIHNVDYKIVNCFDSDILNQLKDCDGLMWHWTLADHKAVLFARQLTWSLQRAGIKVFPDINTCWHYDDKVGQKYLLESVDAPLVNSYVFYDKQKALDWVDQTEFPKVFKTRNGASSRNVKLVKNKKAAIRLINKCFGNGIPGYDKFNAFNESLWKYKRDGDVKSMGRVIKFLVMLPLPKKFQPEYTFQKNYAYFQDFLPHNQFDIRVIVIGDRAFGIKRYVRENDFRASGSGKLEYSKEAIPDNCVETAFKITSKLNTQSLSLDFIFSGNKQLVIEISYAFPVGKFAGDCPGYWDNEMTWHEGSFQPEHFMIEDLINAIDNEKSILELREGHSFNNENGNRMYL